MIKSNDAIRSTREHCAFCFDIIQSALNNKKAPVYPPSLPIFKSPLFVTWHIDGDDLRGCIGTFSGTESIEKVLPQYAMISAFKDSRFDPISIAELPRLSVSVSLLVNFEHDKTAYDWTVGKHGIEIKFPHNGRSLSATFLPEVAAEQNWDQKTTLIHLISKAGYRGKDIDSIIQSINLTTYESSKCTLTYQEFMKM